MKKLLSILFLISWLGTNAFSSNYYVSTTGNDSNAGTEASPFKSLQHAIDIVQPGDFIYIRQGTYAISTQVNILSANDGTSASPKRIWAFPGEHPILDFSSQPYGSTSSVNNPRGIQIAGDYWHVKGLEVKGAADNGIFVTGNHNTVESCLIHNNRDSGLQIARNSSSSTKAEWPSFNLILNCESYDNYDIAPNGGENADGFACKLTSGPGNKFVGCYSHNNIDDGWDLYTKAETGAIDPVVLDRCIAAKNGTLTNGTANPNGDRNGFKLGGEKIAVAHIVTRCVAFGNGHNGFTWNSNPGAIRLSNCLAFDNDEGNYKFGDNSTATATVYTNNISFWTKTALASDKTVGTDVSSTNIWWDKSKAQPSINGKGLIVTAADFAASLANPSISRDADGSLNFNAFKLASGSDLINAGEVPAGELPFTPSSYYVGAPDLGAIEFGGSTPVSFSLTTTVVGQGSVTPNSGSFQSGASVSLTATPATGWKFDGWSGAVTGTTNPVTLTMNANKAVTATFSQITTTKFTLTTTTSGSGSVGLSPAGGSYDAGTSVALTATPATGWKFDGWSGAVTGTTNLATITMSANKSVTATFSQITTTKYTLTTTTSGSGSVGLSPAGGSYDAGSSVTLTATPAAGWKFNGWSGAVTGTTNPVAITMNANKAVTATFVQLPCTYTEYQIENGTFSSGSVKETVNAGFTGASYINTNNVIGSWFEIIVSAPSAGNYSMKLRYANNGTADRPVSVAVGGTSVISSLSMPLTGAWTTWVLKDLTVALKAGNNTIRFTALTAEGAPNADRLDVCNNGGAALRSIASLENTSSTDISVSQNYPNPVEGYTTIGVWLKEAGNVKINLYSASGSKVAIIADRKMDKGLNEVRFESNGLKSGVYIYHVEATHGRVNKKMIIK